MRRLVRIQIRVTEQQHKELTRLAEADNRTVQNLVEVVAVPEFIDRALRRHKRKVERLEYPD